MKKLLIPALLAALLAACSTTPLPEDGAGAPVESRSGSSSGVTPVTAGGLDASGLPRELTDAKSKLSQRSIYFDLDSYEVKDEYNDLVAAHAKYLTANKGFKVGGVDLCPFFGVLIEWTTWQGFRKRPELSPFVINHHANLNSA